MLVKDVVNLFCSLTDNVVHWPSLAELNDVENAFQQMANFPGVLGTMELRRPCISAYGVI